MRGFVLPALLLSLIPVAALASGTAQIQKPDGSLKRYDGVRITILHRQMSITSADGIGTIVIQRAGCVVVDKLLRCHPYEAELRQRGETMPIAIAEGTAWFNPSDETQTLPKSSTRIPPKGVVMSMSTQRGIYLSLTGTVDKVTR